MACVLYSAVDTSVNKTILPHLVRMGHRTVEWTPQTRTPADLSLAIIECRRDNRTEAVVRTVRTAGIPAIAVVACSTEDLAVWALRLGFVDYLKCPIPYEVFRKTIDQYLAAKNRAMQENRATDTIIGDSPQIRELRAEIERVAVADSTVLVLGETGTGKELVARSVHCASSRRNGPLICVNCAAIPDSLIESELFGHQRGSFTGAVTSQSGILRQANGGTLFLDEIGELSSLAQVKLLRAIETRSVTAIGSSAPVEVDIRVVAATNQDLETLMHSNAFRRDLFFRLNVLRLSLPPLRERSGDVALLIQHYLEQLRPKFGGKLRRFSPQAMHVLLEYDWPGNIRELSNVVEASLVQGAPNHRGELELPPHFPNAKDLGCPLTERQRLVAALSETHWNITMTASKMNWSRMTVYRKMTAYQLRKHAFRSVS
jgi:DNA-binding NtrC family response regulator